MNREFLLAERIASARLARTLAPPGYRSINKPFASQGRTDAASFVDPDMRILIATVTAGGGHVAAAAALEEAWRSLRANDTLERVDLLKFFSPLHRRLYAEGYV